MSYPHITTISQTPYQQPYHTPSPTPSNPSPSQPNQPYRNRSRNNQDRTPVQFDPIPMSYTELLPRLIQSSLLVPTPMKPLEPPYPRGYDPNAKCDYHAGAVGHSTENCRALKFRVQDLIDAKWLSFTDDSPNVGSNPLPGHGGPSINAIEGTIEHTLKKSVEDIKTSFRFIFKEMCKFGLIEGSLDDNHACGLHPGTGHAIEHCDDFKQILQDLMDKDFVQVGYVSNNEVAAIDDLVPTFPKPLVIHYTKGVTNPAPSGPRPVTIKIPKPFPYKDNKAVPWRYNVEVCTDNAEENHIKDVNREISEVTNIAGVGSMTRSGRIYAPAELGVKQSKEIVKDKEG